MQQANVGITALYCLGYDRDGEFEVEFTERKANLLRTENKTSSNEQMMRKDKKKASDPDVI